MNEMKFKLAIGILILCGSSFCAEHKVTDQVYFDVEDDGRYIGKIVMGLFGELAPRTVHNFKILATVGVNGRNYEGTIFHRVIQRFMIQGGDVYNNNGLTQESIYGGVFEDENLTLKHNGPGMLSMANSGPNTNGCQFFITTMATPWLDGRHVTFGKVLQGQEVVHIIEHVKTDSDDIPVKPVKIIQSGLLETPDPFFISDEPFDYGIWQWIRAGSVPLSFSFAILAFFHWAIRKLDGFRMV